MTLLATTCLLPCLVSQILFQMVLTASKQLTHVLSAVTIYAIFLIEFGKHFSNCLAVFTRYRFNLSQYLFFFFADPYLIKSLSLVVTVKILLSAVAMAPSCHRYRTRRHRFAVSSRSLHCIVLPSHHRHHAILSSLHRYSIIDANMNHMTLSGFHTF